MTILSDKVQFVIQTHVLLVAHAVCSNPRLLLHHVFGRLQHLLHLGKFCSLRVAVPTNFQQRLLLLSQLTVTLAHVDSF